MTGSSPIELVKPKPKRRRKAIFSSRKQIAASRMRQQKQRYDSLNNTVKALEFTTDRPRSRSRKRTSQSHGAQDIATKGAGVGTTKEVEFPISHDLSRICETQVRTSSRCQHHLGGSVCDVRKCPEGLCRIRQTLENDI